MIIEKITISILLIILLIQAISDAKTMKIYYWLSMIGIVAGGIICIFNVDRLDAVYILVASVIISLSKMMGAYTWGDAKLFFLSLEITVIQKKEFDILIYFLFLDMIAIVIFMVYVLTIKCLKKEKNRKKYPYAPAIFAATFISVFL